MSKKRYADSTPDENPPKRRKLSAHEVLVEAARNGDTTALRAGLDKLDECLALLLPCVETQMGFGILLSECVHADRTACTKVLLQHWKSVCSNVAFVPHGQEDTEDCPCPAMWEDPAVCQVLIDAGADIETKDDMGRSPLHWACRSGALVVVKMLVEAGAGMSVTCNFGNTCLIFASNFGHTEVVRYLVHRNSALINHKSGDHGYRSALFCAACQDHVDVLEVLINAGADIPANVKMLLEEGVVKNRGNSGVQMAAANGHTETVRHLLGLPDVDVNHAFDDGSTAMLAVAGHPIYKAAEANLTEVTKLLIDAGADIEGKDNDGNSPLLLSSENGKQGIVEVLLRAGARVCVTNDEGDTCLAVAAWNGHTETVRTLLCMPEVDVNQTNDGATPLYRAVTENHMEVSKLLIDAGADLDAMSSMGCTPLHRACEEPALEIVEMLLEAGADVTVVDDNGDTCLSIAAGHGQIETVRYLVGLKEVDVNHRNESGLTALQRARQCPRHQVSVSRILLDHGAEE